MAVVLKYVGLNLLQQNMLNRRRRLEQRRRYNAQAVALVERWIQQNFAQQGRLAMGGGGWRPLSAMTIRHRRGRGIGAKILQDTGALRARWKHDWNEKIGRVQSGVDYADEHHEGKGWLPARRIIPLDRQVAPQLAKLLDKFIGGAIR